MFGDLAELVQALVLKKQASVSTIWLLGRLVRPTGRMYKQISGFESQGPHQLLSSARLAGRLRGCSPTVGRQLVKL